MAKSKKLRVVVLFGGRSAEHEVSLSSALGILKHIDKSKYEVIPVKISKQGRWQWLENGQALNSAEELNAAKGPMVIIGDPETQGFYRIENGNINLNAEKIDVIFPILHGTYGEDGTIQGLLSLANIPCVSAGVLASSLGMDKIMMKQIFFQNDLPATDYIWFLRKEWKKSQKVIVKGIRDEIGYPCFIKPANSGSSVGVYKAKNPEDLVLFVNKASEYDRKILVEKAINARELECSVLGNDDPKASVVGEIIPCNEFYDYDAKYILNNSEIIIPADIPEEVSENIRRMAVKSFKALDCSGMGRVDFLMERETDRLFVNEINTIPGFTQISMYPKLWEASGISYSELISQLIELAIERHKDITLSKFKKE
jgi:D-alanine-D-alanine ligase